MQHGPNPVFALADGVLYVATDGTLTAYRLTDNRPLWTQPVGDDASGLTVQPRAGALLANVNSGDGALAVFDLATGEPLWRRTNLNGRRSTVAA